MFFNGLIIEFIIIGAIITHKITDNVRAIINPKNKLFKGSLSSLIGTEKPISQLEAFIGAYEKYFRWLLILLL